MKNFRGFKLCRRKLPRLFKWKVRPTPEPTRMTYGSDQNRGAFSKIMVFARFLHTGAKKLCCTNWDFGLGSGSGSSRGYIRLGGKRNGNVTRAVPKGHLAVYVGESETDTRRVVVPVIYFNHPLFGELLKKSERAYGFNHPGGITLPCGYSEFEKVKMRIAAWDNCQRRIFW